MQENLPSCRPAHGTIVKMKLKKYDIDDPDIRDQIEEEINRFYNEGGNLPPVDNNIPENGHSKDL